MTRKAPPSHSAVAVAPKVKLTSFPALNDEARVFLFSPLFLRPRLPPLYFLSVFFLFFFFSSPFVFVFFFIFFLFFYFVPSAAAYSPAPFPSMRR
jgi:hypothetical protein